MTSHPPGGRAGRPALARAVAVDPAKFAEVYWGRQPLLTRADELAGPDCFTDLLSPEAVDELLSERGLRTPFLRVADRGTVLPASAFTGSGGAGAEGPADGGANPSGQDGGADGSAGEGLADGGANPTGHDGGADGSAS